MRLIDADALMKCIPPEETGSRFAVENAPTIEPEQAGKWTYVTDGYVDYFKCDRCGKPVFADTPYCPNCGAKMEGVTE